MLACVIIEDIDNFLGYVLPDLTTFTAKVEVANDGCIYIDLGKYGVTNEVQDVFQALKEKLAKAQIGIAPTRFTSFVAANQAAPGAFLLIPTEYVEEFLTEQDISLLQIHSENLRRLRLLGIRTLGQLAALEIHDLITQFGKQGRLMAELARGIDPTPLTPYLQATDSWEGIYQTDIWSDDTDFNPCVGAISVDIASSDTGFPQAVYDKDQWLPIYAVIDCWILEAQWWSDHPENSCYFQVLTSGEQLILSQNLETKLWCRY